ncbi:protein enabled homolog isoform X1 [Drosophila kikkawai]|uniref:Protein enabled homolog isoform X1 n=2 Tax=Drosophila kikkawai TaxID=30033 RepID=A0A6P4JLV3_DROKI|nr:proteoglycan 4 isoform X1 [Drosophila kikkawai]
MDYLCILNAFEQNYYNRVKEIERLAAAAAAASSSSPASSASPASSTASTSSASCLNGPSTSSTASSTGSSPSTSVREVAHAAAALAASQRLAAYQGQEQGQGQGMIYQHHRQQMEQLQQSHALRSGSVTPQSQPASDPNSSNMANSLLWQPWRDLQQAAAMHHQLYRQQQQFQKEMRVTAKELPTTKWRRERRQRTAEYQVHDAVSSDREREREDRDMDSPIDMSVSSGTLKHQLRASPPPPYREPLPGTNYAANSRPSVITQAPPKREPPEQAHSSDVAMSDIDEHFRRSLGENYAALFSKKSPTPTPTPTPSPGVTPKQQASPLAHGPPSVSCTAAPVASHLYQQHRSPLALPVLHSPILRSRPESPQLELPPPQDEPLPLSLALHRNQAPPSPPPSAKEAGPALAMTDNEVMEPATPHHTPPRYNTPSPAYAANSVPGGSVGTPNLTTTPTTTPTPTPTLTPTPTATPNPTQPTTQLPTTPSMPAIIRVKAEPGLAAAAASSTQTPPASPTSSTNISIFTKTEASVDDHFAKALGDTWKKLQGGHKE